MMMVLTDALAGCRRLSKSTRKYSLLTHMRISSVSDWSYRYTTEAFSFRRYYFIAAHTISSFSVGVKIMNYIYISLMRALGSFSHSLQPRDISIRLDFLFMCYEHSPLSTSVAAFLRLSFTFREGRPAHAAKFQKSLKAFSFTRYRRHDVSCLSRIKQRTCTASSEMLPAFIDFYPATIFSIVAVASTPPPPCALMPRSRRHRILHR